MLSDSGEPPAEEVSTKTAITRVVGKLMTTTVPLRGLGADRVGGEDRTMNNKRTRFPSSKE